MLTKLFLHRARISLRALTADGQQHQATGDVVLTRDVEVQLGGELEIQ